MIKFLDKYLPKGNFRIFLITGILILIVAFALWWYKQIKYNKENPIFYKKGKDAKKKYVVPSIQMYQLEGGYGYSFSFWYYLKDYKYRQYETKHILTKGNRLPNNKKSKVAGPIICFTPKVNNKRLM